MREMKAFAMRAVRLDRLFTVAVGVVWSAILPIANFTLSETVVDANGQPSSTF